MYHDVIGLESKCTEGSVEAFACGTAIIPISRSKMAQRKGKLFSNSSGRIDIHDGKYFIDGQECTPDEFQKRVPSIKVPQGQKPPFETIKDISGDLRITHEGKDYTIEEFRKIQRERLEMLKK